MTQLPYTPPPLTVQPFSAIQMDALMQELNALRPGRGLSESAAQQLVKQMIAGSVFSAEHDRPRGPLSWTNYTQNKCALYGRVIRDFAAALPPHSFHQFNLSGLQGQAHVASIMRLPVLDAHGQVRTQHYLLDPTLVQFERPDRPRRFSPSMDPLLANGYMPIDEQGAQAYISEFVFPRFFHKQNGEKFQKSGESYLNLLWLAEIGQSHGVPAGPARGA